MTVRMQLLVCWTVGALGLATRVLMSVSRLVNRSSSSPASKKRSSSSRIDSIASSRMLMVAASVGGLTI